MAGTDALGLVREAERRLADAGCGTPRLDAELLVAHAVGTDRGGLFREAGSGLGAGIEVAARELVDRRAAGEPVAYLTGRKWFRGVELAVDPTVLIPRPETELLVEWALSLPAGARVADIGTGSGAIAVALASERPDLDVIATDIDAGALRVAALNAARLDADVAFAAGDLLDAVDGELDAVLSNPPYIPADDVAGLEPEVRDHEPRIALTPGPSGLEAIALLADQAAARSVPRIAVEVGLGQAGEVAAILRRLGWNEVVVIDDLAGIGRVVTGEGRTVEGA